MKNVFLILVVFVAEAAAQKNVSGRVTYLAAGAVYLSIGRDQGFEDSTRVYIIHGTDTTATLQVFAVSSKSSVCRVLEMKQEIQLGDLISAIVSTSQKETQQPQIIVDSTKGEQKKVLPIQSHATAVRNEKGWVNIRGRIGLQYHTVLFDDASMNMQQAGMVASLRGDFSTVPLKFDFYGTIRMTGRNRAAPLSSRGSNESRIYRSSIEYDDQTTIIGIGRILPTYASSVGSVDGISVARRISKFVSGFSIGFQPPSSLQMPSVETKKFSFFAQYQSNDFWNITASTAYARIWSSAGIEREAISTFFSLYTLSGFSLYTNSDVDLRTLTNGENRLSPALSLLICSANYRFSERVTAGLALDASRPVYSFSSNKSIPDSLLDKQLRAGISFNLNISLWRGTGLYNVTTLRFGEEHFGKEYSNSSSAYVNNVLQSGVNVRMNYLLNKSNFMMMHGYGINMQRTVLGVELGIRYQQNRSEVKQSQLTNTTTTLGTDISAYLSNQYTLIGSFDLMHGTGSTTRLFYVELSRRF